MDLKLARKVVLITGSSRGIGLSSAKAFAAEGCRIMLSARSAEQLREAETALRATGAAVAAHAADVSDPGEAAGLIDAADYDEMNRVWGEFFPTDPPARTTCALQLSNGNGVEIECIALAGESTS